MSENKNFENVEKTPCILSLYRYNNRQEKEVEPLTTDERQKVRREKMRVIEKTYYKVHFGIWYEDSATCYTLEDAYHRKNELTALETENGKEPSEKFIYRHHWTRVLDNDSGVIHYEESSKVFVE